MSSVTDKLDTVRSFLESQSTAVLATADAEGAPHCTPIFYLPARTPNPDDFDLFWVSSAGSQHSRNIAARKQISASVFQATFEWRQIAGVQMRGVVSEASHGVCEAVLERYKERFELGTGFSAALAIARLYVFEPRWLRFTDNSRHFGYKFELVREEDGHWR